MFGDDNRSALLGGAGGGPEEMKVRDTVDWLRATLPKVLEAADVRIDVGGPTALIGTSTTDVAKTPSCWCSRSSSVIAFLMLLISIRSVVLALKGVLMTVLVQAAAYGSLGGRLPVGMAGAAGFEPISVFDRQHHPAPWSRR